MQNAECRDKEENRLRAVFCICFQILIYRPTGMRASGGELFEKSSAKTFPKKG